MITKLRALAIGGALTLASVSGNVSAQESGPTLYDKLPSDVLMAVGINDVPAIKSRLGESRFNAAFESPEMAPMRTSIFDALEEMKTKFNEETQLDLDKMLEYSKGDFTFAWVEVVPAEEFGGDEELPSMIAIMEIDPENRDSIQNDIDLLFEELPEEAEKGSYDFQGIDIRTIEFIEENTYEEYEWETGETVMVVDTEPTFIEYGFHENLFFIGNGPGKPAAKVLNSLTNEGETRLSQQAGVVKLDELYQAEGDAEFWVNLPLLFSEVKKIEGDDENLSQAFKFMEASGISDIEGAGAQLSLIGDGLLTELSILMPAEKKPFLDSFYSDEKFALNSAKYVPADAYKFTAYQIDLGKIWDAVMEVLASEFPEQKGQVDFMLSMANAQIQGDLANDIIRKIRGEHFIVQTRDPEGAQRAEELSQEYGFNVPESLLTSFQIGISDQQNFHNSLSSILDMQIEQGMFPFEKTDFQGVTVYDPVVDPSTPSGFGLEIAVGLTKDSVTIGASREALNDIIRLSQSQEEGTGLYSSPDFQSVMSSIEREWLMGIDYTSPDHMIFSMEQFLTTMEMVTDDIELPDSDSLPDADWYKTYFGSIISAGYLKPDAYYVNSIWYTVE